MRPPTTEDPELIRGFRRFTQILQTRIRHLQCNSPRAFGLPLLLLIALPLASCPGPTYNVLPKVERAGSGSREMTSKR
jgi:hypothetical protein